MLTFVPTPIGNLGDISPRALDALDVASVVICEDTRVAKALLSKLSERYGRQFGDKTFYCMNSHNGARALEALSASELENAVYLSDAGMPCISDPGSELVRYAQEHNIAYTVLPGASAAVCALAASGFSDKEFLFYGFLNIKKNRLAQLESLLLEPRAVVLYEAPTRINQLFAELANLAPEREIFAIKEISKLHESSFKTKAAALPKLAREIDLRGEWAIVLAPSKQQAKRGVISTEDVLALDIAPREKAKLLSKLNGQSVKQNYEELLKC